MRDPRDYIIMGAFALVVVVFLVVRTIYRSHRSKKDPFTRADLGHVVAVDLHLSRVRFQPNDPDPLSARVVGVRDADPAGHFVLGPWNRASLLSKQLKRQVFTSTWLINETFPNLALSDRDEIRSAREAMTVKNGYYRFTLPTPVPVTIRESEGGTVQLDEARG